MWWNLVENGQATKGVRFIVSVNISRTRGQKYQILYISLAMICKGKGLYGEKLTEISTHFEAFFAWLVMELSAAIEGVMFDMRQYYIDTIHD